MPGTAVAEPADPTDPSMGMLSILGSSTAIGNEDTLVKIPYSVQCCGGLYCYYCIVGALCAWEEDTAGLEGNWKCLRCGKEVHEVVRHQEISSDVKVEEMD